MKQKFHLMIQTLCSWVEALHDSQGDTQSLVPCNPLPVENESGSLSSAESNNMAHALQTLQKRQKIP